ncbi:MAG: hypothetical protein AB8G26_17590 [Ilumatobacter sp.]
MSSLDTAVLIGAIAATWAMAGVIWVIQVVHYPIFDAIDRGDDDAKWREFGDRHRRSISFVVGPFMAIEGVTGIWLVIDPPGSASRTLPLLAGVLMAVAYGITALVSVPLHERLTDAFDADAHRRLVSTNWLRTAAWSARGIVLLVLALIAIPA